MIWLIFAWTLPGLLAMWWFLAMWVAEGANGKPTGPSMFEVVVAWLVLFAVGTLFGWLTFALAVFLRVRNPLDIY